MTLAHFSTLIQNLDSEEQRTTLANLIAISLHNQKLIISEEFYWELRKYSSYSIEYWDYIVILHYPNKN